MVLIVCHFYYFLLPQYIHFGLKVLTPPKKLSKQDELCFVSVLVWITTRGNVNTFKPKCKIQALHWNMAKYKAIAWKTSSSHQDCSRLKSWESNIIHIWKIVVYLRIFPSNVAIYIWQHGHSNFGMITVEDGSNLSS